MAYATTGELTAWLPDGLTIPVDATRLLASASRAVDRMLMVLGAVYDVDTDNLPTDADVIVALRDATCAQASWWIETGDEQGVASALTSANSGGGPSWGGLVPRFAPGAVEILQTATDSGGSQLCVGAWAR